MSDFRKTYDEVSPITNNMSVLVETDEATGITYKICMESGYVTNSFLLEGSKTTNDLSSSIPRIAFDSRIVDRFNQVWIPTMESTEFAAIYPTVDPNDAQSFIWQVTPIKKLNEDERKNYPNPEKEGEYLDSFVDFDESVEFPQSSFFEAFDYFVSLSNKDSLIGRKNEAVEATAKTAKIIKMDTDKL